MVAPRTSAVTPPRVKDRAEVKPTPQRNEPVISEAIFGVDVSVVEIAPRQQFSINYAKAPTIAAEIYKNYRPDDRQFDKSISERRTLLLHHCTVVV
jgi:hypothetical protein